MSLLVPLIAAIAPFILWPIEIFFPYPHIVEELVKALLIFYLLKLSNNSQKIYGTILVGFFFALSENVLYMINGNPQTLILRFVIKMQMHIITSLVILAGALIDKRLIFLGIILAGFIHYLFNIYVSVR